MPHHKRAHSTSTQPHAVPHAHGLIEPTHFWAAGGYAGTNDQRNAVRAIAPRFIHTSRNAK